MQGMTNDVKSAKLPGLLIRALRTAQMKAKKSNRVRDWHKRLVLQTRQPCRRLCRIGLGPVESDILSGVVAQPAVR